MIRNASGAAFVCTILLAFAAIADAQNTVATWLGNSGSWNDAAHWNTSPYFPGDGLCDYSASIYGGPVMLDQSRTIEDLQVSSSNPLSVTMDLGVNLLSVQAFRFDSGTITGSGTLDVRGELRWNVGWMEGGGVTNAGSGVVFDVHAAGWYGRLNRTLNCYGNSFVQGSPDVPQHFDFEQNAAINVMPNATFNGTRLSITGSNIAGATLGTFTNFGTIILNGSGLRQGMSMSGTVFVNEGTIEITNSFLDLRSTREDMQPLVQNAGTIHLENGDLQLSGKGRLNGGSVIGNGSIGNLESSGLIAPTGNGMNFFASTLTLLQGSVVRYEVVAAQQMAVCPQLFNISTATVSGALEISLSTAAQRRIKTSNIFTLLSATVIAGEFANAANGSRVATDDGRGSFIVTYNLTTIQLSNYRRLKSSPRPH